MYQARFPTVRKKPVMVFDEYYKDKTQAGFYLYVNYVLLSKILNIFWLDVQHCHQVDQRNKSKKFIHT